jgi:molybdopterin molybdotransferase
MTEFLKLVSPTEAMTHLFKYLPDVEIKTETLATMDGLGRVIPEDILAPHQLPEFSRASVDGYAVIARDTFGTSESLPGYLTVIGEVPMGDVPDVEVTPSTCVVIHTGGMLPKGADSVLMLEFTQLIGKTSEQSSQANQTNNDRNNSSQEIEVFRPVAKGENIIFAGEDIHPGQVVAEKGRIIRPADIGSCLALGITNLRVANKPKVGIISSGSELIPPAEQPSIGQVRDVNSYTLAGLIMENGGEPIVYGIIPDDIKKITATARIAISECDIVIISAGSSAGERDRTADIIASLGDPGILVHGINIRPGKPTILSICNGKPVIGLPGNPVSALVIAKIYLVALINHLTGRKQEIIPWSVRALLSVNLPSQAGREDWVAVTIKKRDDNESDIKYFAQPLFGKSNSICTFAKADGLVQIPADANGLNAGDIVEVVPI